MDHDQALAESQAQIGKARRQLNRSRMCLERSRICIEKSDSAVLDSKFVADFCRFSVEDRVMVRRYCDALSGITELPKPCTSK